MSEKSKNQKPFKVRDKRKQGWFYIDNEYLNGFGKIVGPIGIAVYVSLCRHADNNNQSCFPSQKTIADEIGVAERTVKTYISLLKEHNIIGVEREKKGRRWVSNLYYLLDKSEWNSLSRAGDTRDKKNDQGHIKVPSRASDDIHQGHQLPTNYTNNNYTKNKVAKKKTFLHGKEWNELIDAFQEVNPLYEEFYKNKTERNALDIVAKKYGKEKTKLIIDFLPKSNTIKFVPKITKPTELKRNVAKLMAWASEKKNSKKGKVVSFKKS